MTTREFHTQINILLQQINSERKRTIEPEEIDVVANKAVLEVINTNSTGKQHGGVGFDESLTKVDILKDLKRTSGSLAMFKVDTNVLGTYLPADYHRLIKSRSSVVYDCNSVDKEEDTTNTRILVVSFPTVTSAPYYDNFKLMLDGTEMYSYEGAALIKEDAKFRIINGALEEVNRNTEGYTNVSGGITKVSLFWETWADKYYPNSFIVVVNSYTISNLSDVKITYTGGSKSASVYDIVHTIYTNDYTTNSSRPNELVQSDDVDDMLNHPYFNKNRQTNPISTLERNVLEVHHSDLFLIDSVKIRYIKKPRLIDLSLSQMCELQNLEQVIQSTVRQFKARWNDPTYRNELNEVMLNK